MKYNKTFRILGIGIILCLLVIAIPATPALAQSIMLNPTSGTVGTTVNVTGYGYTGYTTVYIFFDTNNVAAATVSGGVITTAFLVPSYATPGSHYVTVRDGSTYATSAQLAMAPFTVTARQITISPSSGYVGDTITVSGTGFNASSNVTIYFDTTSVGTVTTDTSGNFTTVTFTVPESYKGSHTIKAQDGSGNYATTTITVLQQITITPTSGAVGDTVTISGTGFAASKTITFFWDNVSVTTEATTTNTNGSFTNNTFTIPSSSRGSHTIKARDASNNSATATFTIGHKITITPDQGPSGTTVMVTGTGFSANRPITIKYNSVPVITNPAAISTDANGTFAASFNVPAGLASTYPVEASDGTYSASANFVATADATISQTTSQASPGYVGMELTITGTGFMPNATVTITYTTDPVELATVLTDANGAFSVAVTIPPSTGGNHTITVTDGHTTKLFTFVMESQAPPIPAPLVPEEGVKAKAEAYFDWGDVNDDPSGVTYTLQIATDEEFTETSIVLEKEGLTDSEYTLTEEEKLESTKKEAPYYWRVKAVDGASNDRGWTTPGSFYVGFQWPEMKGWLVYTLIGLGGVLVFILGFWLGRRTAYY